VVKRKRCQPIASLVETKRISKKKSDGFVGALPVPKAGFNPMYKLMKETRGIDLTIIDLVLKRHFKVSYQTITYRLYDHKLIINNNRLFAFFKSRFHNQQPLPIDEPLIFSQETKIKALSEKRTRTESGAEA